MYLKDIITALKLVKFIRIKINQKSRFKRAHNIKRNENNEVKN